MARARPAATKEEQVPYVPHGGARELLESRDDEILVCGPAGTGKSISVLTKVYLCAHKYPGMRALIVRKTRESLSESGLVTWEDKVVPPSHPMLQGAQRRLRQVYQYGNGSEIIVGGMDKPGKVMSTDYDLVVVLEATELTEVDWASLISRLRNSKMPYRQIIADCNPAQPTHWLKKRCEEGKTRMILSRHEDNPLLFDHATGQWTDLGANYLAKLDSLPEMMKKRLRHGIWCQAEGAIYEEWNPDIHVVDSFPVPPTWTRYMSVDWGFVHPVVVGFWAADHDGRLYLYREIYRTKTLVEDVAREVRQLWAAELSECQDRTLLQAEAEKWEPERLRVALDELPTLLRPAAILCDHDAEDRKTLERYLELPTRGANKAVSAGLQAVAERLKVQKDGKPRLAIFRDALAHPPDAGQKQAGRPVRTAQEIEGYVWADNKTKEVPLKENDDGCFVAGTLVETTRGPVPVERVAVGDRVLTHLGVARVDEAGPTGEREVVRVVLADGREIVCTAGHPLAITGGGWVRADESLGTTVDTRGYSWKSSGTRPAAAGSARRSSGAATGGFATRPTEPTVTSAASSARGAGVNSAPTGFTSRSGRPRTGRFRAAWWFTTGTKTPPTTPPKIWCWSPRRSTPVFTRTISPRLAPPPPPGTAPPRGGPGTGRTLGRFWATARSWLSGASIAGTSIAPGAKGETASAPAGVAPPHDAPLAPTTRTAPAGSVVASTVRAVTSRRNAARRSVRGVCVVAVERLPGRREVFNLATADGVYFANGILVSNCDAMRYMCMHLSGRKPLIAFSL